MKPTITKPSTSVSLRRLDIGLAYAQRGWPAFPLGDSVFERLAPLPALDGNDQGPEQS